jgi:hypothetical protein
MTKPLIPQAVEDATGSNQPPTPQSSAMAKKTARPPTSVKLTLNWRRNLTDFVTNCVPAGCLHKSAAQGGALPQHPGVWQALPPEGRPIFPIARALRYKALAAFCHKTLMHRGFAGCVRPTERCTAKTPVGQALKVCEVCQRTLTLTLVGR